MNFQDKLDKIWTRISDDDFLANRDRKSVV